MLYTLIRTNHSFIIISKLTNHDKPKGTIRYLSLVDLFTLLQMRLSIRSGKTEWKGLPLLLLARSRSGQCYHIGGVEAQTRFDATSKQSNDLPLSRVNTLGSGEDSMKLKKLMELCTKLSDIVNTAGISINAAKLKLMLLSYCCQTSIRRDLNLEDAGGTDYLPTDTIFEELARMGFEPEVPLNKKDQIRLDEELARSLDAEEQEVARLEKENVKLQEQATLAKIEEWDNVNPIGKKRAKERAKKQESSKRQRMKDDKETDERKEAKENDEAKMKKHMEIVQDKKEIAIDVIPLATKPSMIIEDLETLWKLVKAKHGNMDDYERVFWGDLKVMFEPDIKSEVWRSLQGYKVTIWKLFDSYGVHFVRFKNLHIFMLVEIEIAASIPVITSTNMAQQRHLKLIIGMRMCDQQL
ncbi:hypothetical protein Tco_0103566 [Tanacetum coccineum]